jgi:hypothetical protein
MAFPLSLQRFFLRYKDLFKQVGHFDDLDIDSEKIFILIIKK